MNDLQRFNGVGCQLNVVGLVLLKNGGLEVLKSVVGIFGKGKRTMESDQSGFLIDRHQKCSDIAISDDNFRVLFDQLKVDIRK